MGRGSEKLLDGLSNLAGPLRPENRERLRTALLNPSVDAWDEVYAILITPRYTVWQVIKLLDPHCPTGVAFDRDPAQKWGGYFPDTFTLRKAFLWAAGQDTNASSHA